MALQLERSLNGLAYVRIVVHDQHAPAPNLGRLHQRPFTPGLHASTDPEESTTQSLCGRGEHVTAKPGGRRHDTQVEHRNLSKPHPKLRDLLNAS